VSAPEPAPILPALPIPPPLEPEHPVSSSPVFHHDDAMPMSADPSVRISAADISAAGDAESKPRHAVAADAGSSVLSNLGITGASGGGRRRAKEEPEPAERQAEPDEPEPAASTLRPLPEPVEPVAAPDAGQAGADQTPPVRTGGKRRRSVRLADLLTEAMMAYQSAQDSNEAVGNAELPGPRARPVELDPAVGDEPGYPGPARHGGDTRASDSRWLGSRWDNPGDRS
jgi:hypothetical protein